MNAFLCINIKSKLNLNRAKYISQIYKLGCNVDIDKYNQIEILSWVNKNYPYCFQYEVLYHIQAIAFGSSKIKLVPKSISLLVNLISIKLDHNYISDLSILTNLVNLRSLNIYGNKITDYSTLKNLVNLKSLNINEDVDISELKKSLKDCYFGHAKYELYF